MNHNALRWATQQLVVLAIIATGSLMLLSPSWGDTPRSPTDIAAVIRIGKNYPHVYNNVTYATANSVDLKLDFYASTVSSRPKATLIFMHGGGWMSDYSKESYALMFLPFLQLGWNVANVDYRPSSVSLAPAAVEDCLCALRWLALHAQQFNIDLKQIVLMGNSAGGHLALTTGMIPLSSSGLGGPCPSEGLEMAATPSVKPAAIINWYGVTDVEDLNEGPNQKPYAVLWIGNQTDRESVARLVSPLTYVRSDVPPIITVHGDRDSIVPYSHATRLHEALNDAGVRNKLITIPNGGHGDFSSEALQGAFNQVFDFLRGLGVTLEQN